MANETAMITRDDARKLFWDAGLTYERALTPENIAKLCGLIDEAFEKEKKIKLADPKNGLHLFFWDKVLRKTAVVTKSKTHPGEIQCYIEASGCYFPRRECISFNGSWEIVEKTKKNWIGFCGHADDHNASIVTGAFAEWVEWVKKQKPGMTLERAIEIVFEETVNAHYICINEETGQNDIDDEYKEAEKVIKAKLKGVRYELS